MIPVAELNYGRDKC